MPDRPLVAGVDTSTQSCKVVVCDAETGEVVRTGRGAHPDGTEVDPRHWWAAWQEASGNDILEGVSALAVGGQQHGMVLLDEHGEVVRDALLWNDTRSADAADELVAELGAQAWADATGLVPVAATTVSKLRWMADHEADNLARARTCVLPHDWLTGRILADGATAPDEWTTDGGDASGTGYWSAGTREYRPDLLRLATGTDLAVPRVAAPAEVVGHTASGLAVAAGTGDNMGAALGLGLRPGDVVVSLGTSGTADEQHPLDRAAHRAHGIHGGGEVEQHPLDEGAGQVLGGRVRPGQAVQRAGGRRQVGGALVVEVGQQDEAAGPGCAGQREAVEAGVVGAEHGGAGRVHPGGVEGAHEREEAALGVRERLHAARGVGRRARVAGEGGTARAERDDDVAGTEGQAQGRAHVVARAGSDEQASVGVPGRG